MIPTRPGKGAFEGVPINLPNLAGGRPAPSAPVVVLDRGFPRAIANRVNPVTLKSEPTSRQLSNLRNVCYVSHLNVVPTARRDAMLQQLKQKGIEIGIHYAIPVQRQPPLR